MKSALSKSQSIATPPRIQGGRGIPGRIFARDPHREQIHAVFLRQGKIILRTTALLCILRWDRRLCRLLRHAGDNGRRLIRGPTTGRCLVSLEQLTLTLPWSIVIYINSDGRYNQSSLSFKILNIVDLLNSKPVLMVLSVLK